MKFHIHEEPLRDIGRLDKTTARQIMSKIKWLSDNADVIKPTGLRNNLSQYSKLRVGDYRIFYTIDTDANLLEVHVVGHRSEVYKK